MDAAEITAYMIILRLWRERDDIPYDVILVRWYKLIFLHSDTTEDGTCAFNIVKSIQRNAVTEHCVYQVLYLLEVREELHKVMESKGNFKIRELWDDETLG